MALTNEELIALGRKVVGQREKDKARGKAASKSLRELKNNHLDEYKALLKKYSS